MGQLLFDFPDPPSDSEPPHCSEEEKCAEPAKARASRTDFVIQVKEQS